MPDTSRTVLHAGTSAEQMGILICILVSAHAVEMPQGCICSLDCGSVLLLMVQARKECYIVKPSCLTYSGKTKTWILYNTMDSVTSRLGAVNGASSIM